MRLKPIILLLLLLATAGCKANKAPSSTSAAPPASPANTQAATALPVTQSSSPIQSKLSAARLDACALLSSEEIKSVQGEPVKETKLSAQSDGGLDLSQCFFALPTFTNSVSLQVVQKGEGAGARDPREFWRETFHENKERERERGEEGEETSPPKRIAGIGDEAFWMGSRIGGSLYVLKGHSYVRVSVGGPADHADKIRRSKALAQKVLARVS